MVFVLRRFYLHRKNNGSTQCVTVKFQESQKWFITIFYVLLQEIDFLCPSALKIKRVLDKHDNHFHSQISSSLILNSDTVI